MYVSINSQYYRDDEETPQLREAQDEWVLDAFKEAVRYRAQHLVLLSHVAPFVGDEEEQVSRSLSGTLSGAHARARPRQHTSVARARTVRTRGTTG